MNILVISGSTRRGSFNTRLARLIAEVRPDDRVTVINDLDTIPFYDGDVEAAGTPATVAALREAVVRSDLLVFVTPEYNGTVPGVLGNAVDWLSRPHGHSVLQAKPVLVLSASPSRFGAVRAAEHLRSVLDRIGCTVVPTGLSVTAAQQRLSEDIIDPDVVDGLGDVMAQAVGTAAATARLDDAAAA